MVSHISAKRLPILFAEEKDREEVNLWPSNFAGLSQPKAKNNGITVGKAKLFDSAALRTMLNATAAQLGALSGFNAASITAAFGNLQGVSRDTSFLSAQITTATKRPGRWRESRH